MTKPPLNNKGFGLLGILAVIVVLCAVGGAGAYVYQQNHKTKTVASATKSSTNQTGKTKTTSPPTPSDLSISAATQLLTTFYKQYSTINLATTTRSTMINLVGQYGTSNLMAYYAPKSGYSYPADPILCAQAQPTSVSVGNVTSTTTSAAGVVTEMFGSDKVKIDATVVSQSGKLMINSITCSPALTASSGGP